MEPARGDCEFEWEEDEQGEDVEGGPVGEEGVRLDALEGQHGAAELDLGGGIGSDLGEGVGEDRHQHR